MYTAQSFDLALWAVFVWLPRYSRRHPLQIFHKKQLQLHLRDLTARSVAACENAGLTLMHLHRIALGPVLLDDLPLGLARGDPENPWDLRRGSPGMLLVYTKGGLENYLVGGFKHEFYFPWSMGCHPNPIDELIFFKMVIAPPSRLW